VVQSPRSEGGDFEVADEISEEGRQARFAQWEKLGLDAIKQDLATGGYRLVGGPPQVRVLAREWVQMKETELRTVSEVLGLSRNPVLDALRLRTTPLDDILRGEGPGTLNYALQSTAGTIDVAASSSPAKPVSEPPSSKPSAEVFTLKPTVYGVGVDLKELACRVRAWRARRRGKAT
jgi:hypothetical protein